MQESDFDNEALKRRDQIAAILARGVARYLGVRVPQTPEAHAKIANSGTTEKFQIFRATRRRDGIYNK